MDPVKGTKPPVSEQGDASKKGMPKMAPSLRDNFGIRSSVVVDPQDDSSTATHSTCENFIPADVVMADPPSPAPRVGDLTDGGNSFPLTMSPPIIGQESSLASLPNTLSPSNFQNNEPMPPNQNISAASKNKDDWEGLPFVKTDESGHEDPSPSVQRPLIDANQPSYNTRRWTSGGNKTVDHLNNAMLKTSQVNEANQGKVPYNPFKASWKSSTGAKVSTNCRQRGVVFGITFG